MTQKYGIINFSSNCYLNVIIQLFLSYKNTSNIIAHYLEYDNKRGVINPRPLMNKLSSKINVNIQNDSQEIFTLILDTIKDLEKYFENKIKYHYTCQVCNKKRITEDIFSTFYVYSDSLEESVKQTVNKEIFTLECEHCKKNTETSKIGYVDKLGEVLIFYNIVKNNIKITETITFSDKIYKLSGFVKHYGIQQSGHYVFVDYVNKLIIDDTLISKYENESLDNIYLVIYTL